MIVSNLSFHLDRRVDPAGIHPYAHFLFRQQANAFIFWMTHVNKIRTGLSKPISLRIELVSPANQPSVQPLDGSTCVIDLPLPSDRYSSLPLTLVEGRMSKIFRAKGLTTEPETHPFFHEQEANALFLEILIRSLSQCSEIFHADIEKVQESFQKFVDNKYVVSWIKARRRFTEFQGTAELEYILDAYSLRKEVVLRRKTVEIDRCLVVESGTDSFEWGGPFPMKIEGREVVMGYGTYRYEPFHGVRVVSLSPNKTSD